jgi:hypothetical protein
MKYRVVFCIGMDSGYVVILICGKNEYRSEFRYSSYDSAQNAARRTGATKLR